MAATLGNVAMTVTIFGFFTFEKMPEQQEAQNDESVLQHSPTIQKCLRARRLYSFALLFVG